MNMNDERVVECDDGTTWFVTRCAYCPRYHEVVKDRLRDVRDGHCDEYGRIPADTNGTIWTGCRQRKRY